MTQPPTPTPDPTDDELLRFVAEFRGWRQVHFARGQVIGIRRNDLMDNWFPVPDYLNDLNAWQEVWSKIESIGGDLPRLWGHRLAYDLQGGGPVYYGPTKPNVLNATARQRSLALFRALDGKLPTTTKKAVAPPT